MSSEQYLQDNNVGIVAVVEVVEEEEVGYKLVDYNLGKWVAANNSYQS